MYAKHVLTKRLRIGQIFDCQGDTFVAKFLWSPRGWKRSHTTRSHCVNIQLCVYAQVQLHAIVYHWALGLFFGIRHCRLELVFVSVHIREATSNSIISVTMLKCANLSCLRKIKQTAKRMPNKHFSTENNLQFNCSLHVAIYTVQWNAKMYHKYTAK